MKKLLKPVKINRPKRQGRLLAFGMTGAMALAVSACDQSSQVMIAPPIQFAPNQTPYYMSTNQAPTSPYVYSNPTCGPYLGAHGYYPIYGYPNYYYKPAPGSTVELVTGGSPTYQASSPAAAEDDVARGGFGESGGGEGEGHGGEGGHGGGE